MNLMPTIHWVKGLDPVADAFAATVYSDVVSMKGYHGALFLVYKGVGTTGTATITVQACDDFTPSNRSAVPFYYRAITSGDTQGSRTYCAATGFVTTAGSSQLYEIYVPAEHLLASGYPNIQLKSVEVVDDPVLGGIAIALVNPKFDQDVTPTAIA